MKTFSSFLTQKGRWLLATLTLLFSLSIGQVWGGVTFTAQDFLDAKHDNTEHATCSAASGLTLKTGDDQLDYYSNNKLDGIQISSSTTNQVSKASSYVEVKADKGYAVSSIEFKSVVSNNSDAAIAVVGWVADINSTSCDYFATPSFPKKNNTSAPSNTTVSFTGDYRTIRIYRQILINGTGNTFESTGDSYKRGAGKSINLFEATVTTKLAPMIEGDSQMLNDETITLTGYPSGGSWNFVSGPGAIASDGKLTANGNGTICVSYTYSDVTVTKDITSAATKTLVWNFDTKDVLPTTAGVTVASPEEKNGGFNSDGTFKLSSNGHYAYIDLTSINLVVTAAVLNAKTGSQSKPISFGSAASDVADGTTSNSTSTDFENFEITPVKESRIFSVIKNSATSATLKQITLTVKKYVAPSTYTVTLNPAGGSIDPVPSGWTYDDVNGKYIKANVEDGSSVDLLDLTKDGYKLNGWKDGENADYTSPVTIDGADLTLTAQWAQTYAVTYVPNNGVLPAETMTDNNAPYKAGDEVTLLANTFTAPENKEFDAWVVTPTAGGDPITVTAGKFTMPAAAVTVTATWKDACAAAPTVSATTLGTTSYTTQVVNCAGISVLGSAGCTISEYGFVYGTATAPTISDNKKALEGDYTVAGTAFPATTLTGLAMNTKYYVRAYATNSFGTAYGSEVEFTTLAALGNVAFIASSADATTDAITALRDNGFIVTVRTKAATPDYTGVDLVVLDETLGWGSSSDEVGTVISADVPILNLKAFFYTKGSSARWGWGTPVNLSPKSELATLSTEYCNTSNHPIFEGVTITAGAVDMIGTSKDGNNLQGVTTNTLVDGKQGYTLATSATGTTCIHELTPAQRGVSTAKYLLIALSNNIQNNYSDDAKKMIVNAAKYLIGNTAWVPVIAPTLSSSVPANSATDVAVEGNIVLTFSENVTVSDASKFTLSGGAGSLTTASISVSGAAVTIPYTGLDNSTEYTLATAAGAVENAGHISNAALSNIVFTTEAACTKPGAIEHLATSDLAFTSVNLSWDAAANSDGYKISIMQGENVFLDWTDNATTSYAATGLTQGTEYTFKVKAKGATGYCEFGLEATLDFETPTPSVDDLVTIADDYTFTPTAALTANTLYEEGKLISLGDGNGWSSGLVIKTNRPLAFKVAATAKVKVTFTENSTRKMQVGSDLSAGNYDTYGSSNKSPLIVDVAAGGVVYLTADGSNQLSMTKLEIMYPHTVTYYLNGGEGTTPTQASKYVGEKFTAHDGETGITAPTGKEFDKWVDQDDENVASGAEYTMPAKAVTLTAAWRDETVKYSVTYDLGDYTAGVAPTETDKAAGAEFAIKAAPEWTDHDFLGWVCDIDAQTYQATNVYTMTAVPTTFTAQWQAFFTITYKDGDDVLDTEKVNVGDSPVGIEEPTKELYSFAGWTRVGETDLVDPTTLTENTILVAKWVDFDGCAYLAVDVEATAKLAVGDNVALKNTSFGGNVKVANMNSTDGDGSIRYHANGLYLTGGGKDSLRVTLENKMKAGTKITVRLQAAGTGERGLKLRTLTKSEVATLGWSSATDNAVKSFSYTVVANDGLDGKKGFLLSRNGSVYLKYISVEECAPEEFVVTYMDGETEMGTENVYSGNHPTATGISTHKVGYAFQGWKETADGSVVELNTITISAAKTLYAAYAAIDCSGNGVKFSQVAKANTLEADYSLSGTTEVSIGEYATVTGGEVYLNNNSSNTRVKITKTTSVIQLTGGDEGYIHVLLDCPLKTDDTIKVDNTNKWVIAHNASKTDKVQLASGVHHFIVPSTWNNKGEFYIWRDGSSCNISTIKVIRPAKYTVSFNMKGHGSAIADIENVLEGSKISAPSPAPTDEDYAFAGWYKETTLENEWDFDNDVVNAATTLYAKWLDKSDATLKSLKYGSTDIELEDGVYVYAVQLPSLTTSVPALTAVANNPNANAGVTDADAFDGEGHATSTVLVTPQKVGAATQTYTVNFTKLPSLPLLDVEASITWNFANAGTQNSQFMNEVLANFPDVTNDETFKAQSLKASGERIKDGYLQGTPVMFRTTKAGMVRVEFANTGSSTRPYRYLVVNGVRTEYKSNGTGHVTTAWMEVPAGDVILEGECVADANGSCTSDNLNFYKIEFRTPDYTRTEMLGNGVYGTLCVPNNVPVEWIHGATFYELVGREPQYGKIAFDEITSGELTAGKPYVFQAHGDNLVLYYGTTHVDDPVNGNGMYGTFEAITLPDDVPAIDNLNDIYYFAQGALWSCVDLTSLSVPANRAYVKLSEIPDAPTQQPAPGRRRISMGVNGKNTATGMDEITNDQSQMTNKVIIDGHLFILRGEKMYDATGRLVK